MATLLSNASADGFGPDVTVTSSFANVRVSGMPDYTPIRVRLHWGESVGVEEPLKDVLFSDGSYPVDLPAGSGNIKAEVLGISGRAGISIGSEITFG